MAILTHEDRAFFSKNGYLTVPNAIPPPNLQAVIEAIWAFLEMDPRDPEDWYRPPLRPGGMVEMYHHQSMWDNRQHPRIYQVFAELLGSERLWVSMDRVSMKPPRHASHPDYDHQGFIHWDADTSQRPLPTGVQGVLYLSDTAADQGGYQCVPGLFRTLESWLETQPKDRNPRVPDLKGFNVEPIPGRAGDLLIWHRLLPHGNGRNVSDRPRLAQYITMYPTDYGNPDASEEARAAAEARREARLRAWQERLPPEGSAFPGDPRGWERQHGRPADLTPLGKRLLGLDSWS